MRLRAVLFALAVVIGIGLTSPAGASPGPGTFTRVTTPSGTTTLHLPASGLTHLIISGATSNDVASVDIYCLYTNAGHVIPFQKLATAVPVIGGVFSANVTIEVIIFTCRIRAIPTGVDPTLAYLGSYTGPILYEAFLVPAKVAGTAFEYVADASHGQGELIVRDAGGPCAIDSFAIITTPTMDLEGPNVGEGCSFSLPGSMLGSSPTASAIKVGPHNAYLPSPVETLLHDQLGLPVTPSALTVTRSVAGNGDVTIAESEPLLRCSVNDTYPPTNGSCPALVSTGVRFARVTTLIRNGYQVRVRDTFSSTDGHLHTVSVGYQQSVPLPPTGGLGFMYPGHASSFGGPTPNQNVTGFGTAAGAMYVRTDRFSFEGDSQNNTIGFTWSRPPASIHHTDNRLSDFDMRYALDVPAGGAAFVGFAESKNVTTAQVKSLAAAAVGDMVNAPSISSPAKNAVIGSTVTTVTGMITAGGNGLPTSVTVNGHAATIHKTSATGATYAVTFTEPVGKHTITVTARDTVGNARSTSITVTNV
jgi:hypothetical protein